KSKSVVLWPSWYCPKEHRGQTESKSGDPPPEKAMGVVRLMGTPEIVTSYTCYECHSGAPRPLRLGDHSRRIRSLPLSKHPLRPGRCLRAGARGFSHTTVAFIRSGNDCHVAIAVCHEQWAHCRALHAMQRTTLLAGLGRHPSRQRTGNALRCSRGVVSQM